MKTFTHNKTILATVIFCLALAFSACQKEANLSNPPDTEDSITDDEAATLSSESVEAEAAFDDADDIAFTAADEEGTAGGFGIDGRTAGSDQGRIFLPHFLALRDRIGDCATITITPNDSTYPKTIVIDFGDSCRGRDGKVRSGKLILHFTGPIRRPGSVVTLHFQNYYVNRIHIQGTKTFKNLSDPPVAKWSIAVNDGKVTFPNGRGYSYEGMKTVTQIAGMQTAAVWDDVFKITGHSFTVFNNSNKHVFINTVDPLIKKVACHWISDGTLKIQINRRVLKLDFGFPNNGNCDNKALLTWNNGNSQKVIILP
ncbi:MAG TPA: hypothetical protein PKW62_05140 [Chitinophagaceae bacterium]|nr:hypothetical protein [Chitinophagaceae bacterium]HQV06122.1 hypothetical protein [Chitinophagaceae bacterium]